MNEKQETVKAKFYQLFWFFVIGSLLGTFYEAILCLIQTGHISYRQGLIYGPFYPVYGFGAVLFLLTIDRMKRPVPIFVVGTLLGGFYEFMASFLQDLVFHTVNWDYSNVFLNLDGRTSFFHAIGWGVAGLLFVYFLAPLLKRMIHHFPKKFSFVLTWVLVFFFLFDFSITSFALYRFQERQKNMIATHFLDFVLDDYYPDYFIKKRFPTMKESSRIRN